MAVLEEIPVLSQLTGNTQTGLELCAYFGTGIDITIACPDTRLNLGDYIQTDPFKIRVALAPEPAFSLIFGMDVIIINQPHPIHFDVALELGPLEAGGSATMISYWENPFGIQGLRIGPEVALEIGINYVQFASTGTPPTFGIVGGIAVGDVETQMAFSISSTSAQQILMGKFIKLSPQDLVKFANKLTNTDISLDHIPDFIEFHDLNIYIAPLGGSIGTIIFEPGISFAGEMVLCGKSTSINARINDNGFVAQGYIDRLDIGPLKIRGKNGENAFLDMELTTARKSVYIDGAIDLFNCTAEAFVDISVQGVEFDFKQKIMDILSCDIHGKNNGSINDLSSPPGFDLSGELTLAGSRVTVNGDIKASGEFILEGDADIKLAGYDCANACVTFSNSVVHVAGSVNVGGYLFRVKN